MIIKRLIGKHYEVGTYTCERCGGSGEYPSTEYDGVCLKCNGKGKLNGKHLVYDFEEDYIEDEVYYAQLEEQKLALEKKEKEEQDSKRESAKNITIGYVYIKDWFIRKCDVFLADSYKYGYDKETDKAFRLIDEYGVVVTWCPKSATMSVKEHNAIKVKEYEEMLEELEQDRQVLEVEYSNKQEELNNRLSTLTEEQKNVDYLMDIVQDILGEIKGKINRVDDKIKIFKDKINELNK